LPSGRSSARLDEAVGSVVDRIRAWLRREESAVEAVVEGGEPVATPPTGDRDRETSTNAQTEGAAGQPWPGDR
jgi:hypothetical protein